MNISVYQEDPSDIWSSNGIRYNINKILDVAHEKETQELPIKYFRSQVENSKIEVSRNLLCGSCYEQVRNLKKAQENHKNRVQNTDYTIPVIVFKEKDKWRVVDGAHRIEKALHENKEIILVKILMTEDMLKAKSLID